MGTPVLLVVVVLTAVLLGACGTTDAAAPASGGSSRTPAAAPSPEPDDTASPATTGQSVPGPAGAVRSSVPAGLEPVRISIPSIGVDAPVGTLGIADDGSIEVPQDADRTGWLDTTPAPGQQGPAVVAGHVDSTTGPAVFYRLRTLEVGARIDVTRRDGSTARFTVDGVRSYPQNQFPTAEVYGPVPGPVLRLITCGGDYVKARGGYQDNVVVYAS